LAPFGFRSRSVPRSPSRSTPVIAIGQHVFVNCPGNRSVPLADESGRILSAVHLADGAEIEVVAWRPRGGNETRYRVRALSNGADGWIPAENLRKVLVPLAAPRSPTAPATLVTDTGERRSGQRAPTHRPLASESPTPARLTPTDDAVGRRFGQRF